MTMKISKWCVLLAAVFMLSGCGETQVENREFPAILTVASGADFSKEWLNGQQEGTKKVDYNHLKVVLIERGFLEEEAGMAEMLTLLKSDKNVPLNAYVLTTENLPEVAEAQLEIPLGNYLEELLEHSDTVKKETYPTIGMLYQEAENHMETLFIPCISLVEEKPAVTAYEVYKRGEAEGIVETDAALLSFFIADQMKRYVLQLGEQHFVELSNAENELSFEWERMENGLLKKQVIVDIDCDGKLLSKAKGELSEEVQDSLELAVREYMTVKAGEMLERKIDVTNSLKKADSEREWYAYFAKAPERYEEEIEIIFQVDIDWID